MPGEVKDPIAPQLALAKARSPQQIRAEIERARQQLASSVIAFRDEVSERADWRSYVRRKPVHFIAGAFALGFLFAFRRR